MTDKINKDMMIAEALEKYPESARVLKESGIHCLGCIAAHGESLEQGLSAHGKGKKEIDEIIKQMNELVEKKG